MNNTVSKIYKEINDAWGLPQNYKGIDFHPIALKYTNYLDLLYLLFGQPKKHFAEPILLKMSYLQFLLHAVFRSEKEPEIVWGDLKKFLSHVTRTDNILISYEMNEKSFGDWDQVIVKISIDDITFSENEFDNIREIVLEQNGVGVNFIDDYTPDLEVKLQSLNRSGDATLLDEVFTFCALTNKDAKEVAEYTLFQFKMQMEKSMALLDYKMYRPLEATGEIEVKGGKIPHFLYPSNRNKGRYDSILMRKEDFLKSDIFKASASS